ncbi:MAG: ABC transporter ATP-binding protein [Veillonellaceae bacterium]|nr:ABC transporter ATP-binding protein [Veillonellaceae bacterium]
MHSIVLENVSKRFGDKVVIDDMNLAVRKGERLILLGSSGCGKSTVLRMIAGLETVTSGTLRLNGEVANDMDAGDRGVAMVFQNYALFPHMTVEDNISYGLRIRKLPKEEIGRRVREAMELLQLDGLAERLPRQLSGGQRQRVALCRALVNQADFFFLDEPLSNLDAQLRAHARKELVKIHELYGQTLLYVTHDQIEAMTVGQRIAVLDGGKVQMLDTPQRVYSRPANLFVATFIGSPSMNIIPVERTEHGLRINGTDIVPDAAWRQVLAAADTRDLRLGIRPEHMTLTTEPEEGAVPIEITYVEDYGNHVGYYFTANEKEIIAIRSERAIAAGSTAYWRPDSQRLHFFAGETGLNIGYPAEWEA